MIKTAVLLAAFGAACVDAIAVGDRVPAVELDYGFPPTKVNLAERVAGKNVILVSLPGAFTPTWSTVQIPGYIERAADLKKQGVDEVIVFCVNDGAVMDAWAQDQEISKSDGLITFMADPAGDLTNALDIQMTHPGPMGVGLYGRLGGGRSKRTAMYLVDGVVKIMRVAEREDDPAGDAFPFSTCAPALVEAITALQDPFKGEL